MNHRYIDEFSVAERYVENALPPEERVAFEEHLVDCQECTDRLLLAEMFHARMPNGAGPPSAPSGAQSTLVLRAKPWKLVVLAIIALLALSIPAFVMIHVFLRSH